MYHAHYAVLEPVLIYCSMLTGCVAIYKRGRTRFAEVISLNQLANLMRRA